jgi:signal transduction histidine kinase
MKMAFKKSWVKVVSVILTAIFAFTAAAALVGVSFLANYGAYNGLGEANILAGALESKLYQEAVIVEDYFAIVENKAQNTADYYQTRYSAENSNVRFKVKDAAGEAVLSNGSEQQPLAKVTTNFERDGKNYTLELSVTRALSAPDEYKTMASSLSSMYSARYWLIAAVCVFTILALVLFGFLLYGAGRREDADGMTLSFADKIPCDLYTGLFIIAIALTFAGLTGGNFGGEWELYNIYTYAVAGAFAAWFTMLATLLCMSWAVRIRAGKWWRNSVIYYVLRWLKKPYNGIKNLFKSLPVIWKTALAVLAAFIFQFICFGTRNGLMWFLVNLIIALAVLYAALEAKKLCAAAAALAAGRFETKLDTSNMHFDFKTHGDDLNSIGDGIALAVEERMKSEHMKTELITNVSHDIKTPLTSIINYVDLLKKEDVQPEKAKEYIEVLDRQSRRLKKLAEDVVEASKASTGNIPVELSAADMNVLLEQAAGEYRDKLAENNLELVMTLWDKPLIIMADGRLLWRVFDNVMGNALKYAMPGTRIYVTSKLKDGIASAEFKNVSASQLNISADELMERFTRGDSSRNTEGSGLGLSIADSLTRLQNGDFGIDIDGDLFKARVSFRAAE